MHEMNRSDKVRKGYLGVQANYAILSRNKTKRGTEGGTEG